MKKTIVCYAQLGKLYVEKVYPSLDVVNFCLDAENRFLLTKENDINWLKKNVPGIRIIKAVYTEELIETEI